VELLVRAVAVLEALAGMAQPATLPAVTERVGLPQTQVYRALRALERAGFVDHVGREGYRAGARALSLGALLGPRPELRELARPVLVRLAGAVAGVVTLHLRSGGYRVLLLAAVAPSLRGGPEPTVSLGERASLTRGCSGRAILAHLPAREIDAVLAAAGRPAATTRAELAAIRRDGYAISLSDNHAEHHGVSTALLDPEGAGPLGSLTVSGDASRFGEGTLRELSVRLRAAAAELAPVLATVLGPHASSHQGPLDVGDLLGG
jgi:IclR family transcriptional regulator, acetate operon repressor